MNNDGWIELFRHRDGGHRPTLVEGDLRGDRVRITVEGDVFQVDLPPLIWERLHTAVCRADRRGVGAQPESLTGRQSTVLEIIRDSISETGQSPTVGEIATALGIERSTVHGHLKKIEDKHFITISGGARGLRLLKKETENV